ncbi:MAG: electron transport complex subunit RsxC [Candidatus Dactylopiibacterium carminicum]|uniref:Ion-translocating oxidoreductase complex subunit C n=1 Tax=Candidatus Dactylopiibacterium carminicum TaxID=857335 RepID=A0A272EQY7_9RHOO|nr:electron transport complex subunit RsxC [Candidatus Dactylopiibacterium carminicum]KAF7598687.1 electron transport complex subunit RsxC [Candidatus Dactylopiibacterium carminicum]PAS92504.1 MAG: electron transport complex subunit RsxC [Candidatus Dactylopiibacterium carminicum]PAS96300.1 MAG: electron transport complex subunit RsxC [Candidatus Dactylopiibacterium carminicum]PAS98554.1 MAG: electron transporter RnfC [Candidatus Dactylopiibacterium carminicum]
MKTNYPIRGGVHPLYRKELACNQSIQPFPLAERLYVHLQQHVGAIAVPLVEVGQHVKKGDRIAMAPASMSSPLHAPTSGIVRAIEDFTAAHASGLSQMAVVIEPDGKDEWGELLAPIADPFGVPPDVIIARVAEAGIVGQGGAVFPTAVKLGMGKQYKLDTLLLNGAECEPYITADDRVMREYAAEVVDGARIMAHTLGVQKIIIAIKKNKPEAIEIMTAAAAEYPQISVVGVKIQYPIGYAQYLTQAVTGRETPAGRRNAEVGVVVQNVSTALSVHRAVRHGIPLISRVVTVTGTAIRNAGNFEVPIGTPVSALIEHCGGYVQQPRFLVNGGPMMGFLLPSESAPVLKGSVGIVAMASEETVEKAEKPCIRCGSCMEVCPIGLSPVDMAALIRKDRLEEAARLAVGDCIACGSCSWTCPSHIPLVQYFNYANGALWTADKLRRKNDKLKTMAEARVLRLETAKQERLAAQAARKAKAAAAAPVTEEASE